MQVAFIFAGQGSQEPGMGRDLYEHESVFRAELERIDPTGAWRELCFEGTAEQLADTRNTQPCMVAVQCATTALLKSKGVEPAMAFGLSLGEYSALAAAGVLDARDAVELAAFRGEAMASASESISCAMIAVLGLEAALLQQACDEANQAMDEQAAEGAQPGRVYITNYNSPGQIVISGERAAVEAAGAKALELGAKKCIPLAVSGPFHTPYMRPAGDALEERFKTIFMATPQIPVLFNTTARPLQEGQSVAGLLVEQVQSAIHFDDCVSYMVQSGITTVIEVGVGSSLSKMVKKIDRQVQTLQVFDCASLAKTLEALA